MTQTSPAAARQLDAIPVHRKSLSQRLRENWQLYVMLLIPVVLTIVYKYWPMYGIQIAFRDFVRGQGHGWALVRTLDDALAALKALGIPTRIRRT